MLERGLLPEFSTQALAELKGIQFPARRTGEPIRDLTELLWASIDNDDSRDLDQLTAAEAMPNKTLKVRVAVANVDALVKIGSAIDDHARHNTTSVYTPAKNFPMIPEKLSTDLTSLNFNQERLAIVVEMVIEADGSLEKSDIYQALVRNHAKLTYNDVGDWLEGRAPVPEAAAIVNGLARELAFAGPGGTEVEEVSGICTGRSALKRLRRDPYMMAMKFGALMRRRRRIVRRR